MTSSNCASRHPAWSAILPLVLLLAIVLSSCSISSGSTATTGGGLVVQAIPSPTPTALPALTAASSPTPTATAIHATEISTPTATAPAKDGVIWAGTITSATSRQYVINGGTVNVCKTNWLIDLDFVVSSTGDVTGDGKATLTAPADCAPHPLQGNVTGADVLVEGLKDNARFRLRLTSSNYTPQGTAEFAGFTLVFSTAQCEPPPGPRTLEIPMTGDMTAAATINLSEAMTGCAGSKDDVMTNVANVDLHARFACADVPADLQDPEIDKLCQ